MGFFRRAADKLSPARGRGKSAGRDSGRVDDAVAMHLSEFVRTRRGVEAYVEPQTIVTQTTILLVAWDGEWTRRRVPSPQWAYSFAEHHHIPGYDALVIGYPQRMRDYNSRLTRKIGGDRRTPVVVRDTDLPPPSDEPSEALNLTDPPDVPGIDLR